MKISINQIKQHTALDMTDAELVAKIGAQLGAVEEVIEIGMKYDGVIIVKVVNCEQHPNADRLKVCLIDDGGVVQDVERNEDGLVRVVCGAPNVYSGVTVAWLPPGSTVPSSFDADPFVLEARELRGIVSNGMLASPKELAVSDSHEGLLILEDDVAPGTMFADYFNLRGDAVIDIENKMFTHRPDCFGWLGVAREVAGIQCRNFTSPEWYRADVPLVAATNHGLSVEVRNEVPELVPRFIAVPISGVTIAPSPVWLQIELSKVGIRPINNIVDLTNYYMVLTGQPLHAYDYDKIVAQDPGAGHATLVVRKPQQGEKLTLLNGKEIEPRSEAILIASATKAIGLGGVMGGSNTEVDENTKNIILECASFDMYSIRRTSMAHGLFSDAVTRFTKGQSPLQNKAVLAKITEDLLRISGGQVAGDVVDDNHLSEDVLQRNSLYPDVTVSSAFINERLGLRLSIEEMAGLLTNVEFTVHTNADSMTVRAPFWRTDIEISEDVVEEVGRLYGFDKLPLELPKRTITPAAKDQELTAQSDIRERLSRAGANEVLTYSFAHGNLLEKAGQDKSMAYKLTNALSPDLQYYRLSLTPSLLDKVHANIKAGYDEFALFEIGKVHGKTEVDEAGLPKEMGRLGFVFAASEKKSEKSYGGAPYYQAYEYVQSVLPGNVETYTFVPLQEVSSGDYALFEQMTKPYEHGRSAVIYASERPIGIIGEYTQAVKKAFKLPTYCAGFELFLSYFTAKDTVSNPYIAVPKFPKVTQDISLKVDSSLTYRQVYDTILQSLESSSSENILMSLVPLDIFQRTEESGSKQITLRLVVNSYQKTMTDNEVSAMLDTAAAAANQAFGAVRI